MAGHCSCCSFKNSAFERGMVSCDTTSWPFLTCLPLREGVNSEEDTGASEVLVDKYVWKASGDV
jgi:hypothetical protein